MNHEPTRIGPGQVTRARRAARLRGAGWAVRSTLAGKLLAGVYTRRRLPRILARAHRAWRAERIPVHAPAPEPAPPPPDGGPQGLVLLPAGPGSWSDLAEALETVRVFEPHARVVVMDDHSVECRATVVQRHFPEVDVVRARWPCCGPVRMYTQQSLVLRRILREIEFDVLLKLDTDALLIGAGVFEAARERFAQDPRLGLLGAYGTDADGTEEDNSYELWYLTHEVRWSRRLRRLVRRSEAQGHDASQAVQGGAYLVHRRALESLAAAGALGWRQPWWSFAGEDNLMTLFVNASGWDAGSFGAPGEPISSLPSYLPISLEEHVRQGKLVAHSVRRGLDGEPEDAVRAFFRARRTAGRRGAPA